MTRPTTPAEAIAAAALGPKKVTVGTESVEQFTPAELAAAAQFAAHQTAKAKKHSGLRFARFIPPAGGS